MHWRTRDSEELAAKVATADRPGEPEERLMKNLDVFLDFALEKPRLFELMFLKRREGARQFPGDFRAGDRQPLSIPRRRWKPG